MASDGSRLGLSAEAMRERRLQQKRESEQRRRKNRRDDVLQQKRDEAVRNRAAYTERHRIWRHANPEHFRESVRRRTAANRLKVDARAQLRWAVARGEVVRGPCEVCQTTTDVQGHHDDYAKPLEVNWLCREHHRVVHRGE